MSFGRSACERDRRLRSITMSASVVAAIAPCRPGRLPIAAPRQRMKMSGVGHTLSHRFAKPANLDAEILKAG